MNAVSEFISRVGRDTQVCYVGEIWGREYFECKAENFESIEDDGFSADGLSVIFKNGDYMLVDEHENPVLIVAQGE